MPKTVRTAAARPPFAWAPVLHFANAGPTDQTWPSVLLKFQGIRPGPGEKVFGLTSLAEVEPILHEFRALLARLVNTPPGNEIAFSDILSIISARARGTLKGWAPVRGTGRAFPRITTQNDSFEESLYAQLATAMTVEPYTTIKQCSQCQRFFYEPRRRIARLCSARCRARDAKTRAGRYRETHQDAYRAYQRELMAKRRREGKA